MSEEIVKVEHTIVACMVCFGLGILVSSIMICTSNTSVPEDQGKLIKAIGLGFKQVWNLEPGYRYDIVLKDKPYERRIRIEREKEL